MSASLILSPQVLEGLFCAISYELTAMHAMCVYSLIPDAEVMYVVTEIISEIPGLQNFQFSVWINHTSLLTSILKHCSIPEEKHDDVKVLLHKMMVSLPASRKFCW